MSSSPVVPNGALYATEYHTCSECGLTTKGLVPSVVMKEWRHVDLKECGLWKAKIEARYIPKGKLIAQEEKDRLAAMFGKT